MLEIDLILERYLEKGEKTGWTYAKIPEKLALQLKPNNKKSFRVKGKINETPLNQIALIPIGKGDFILPVNGPLRKLIRKEAGQKVHLNLEEDKSEFNFSADFLACLEDESIAHSFFKTLPGSHQRYFSKWIESAKTIETKTKRIAQSLFALSNKMNYPEMIRHFKKT